MLIHTGEKPFHFEVCGARFSMNSALKTHMTTHKRELFHCEMCEARFS